MKSVLSRRVLAPLPLVAAAILSLEPSFAGTIDPRRLVEVVDLSSPTVSPDGRRVAFRTEQASIERDANESAWYVQDIDGDSQPRKVGNGGFPVRNSSGTPEQPAAYWSPDGKYVYYLAMLDDRQDVWRASADGSGAKPLTLDPADVREFFLSDDGRKLAYSVGATRAQVLKAEWDEYENGIRLDASVPVVGALMHSIRTQGRAASPRYSDVGYDRRPMLWDTPDRWQEMDLESGIRRAIPAPPEQVSPGQIAISKGAPMPTRIDREPNGSRIALLLPAQALRGETAEGQVDLAIMSSDRPARQTRCRAKACLAAAISVVQWRPGTDEVIFVTTDRENGRRQSVFRWNVRRNEVAVVAHSQGLLNGGQSMERDGRPGAQPSCGVTRDALVCVAAEASRPPRLERIAIESGHRHVLYAPNATLDVDLQKAVSSRLLRWTSDEGNAYSGYLLEPRVTEVRSRPLFVNYYQCDGFLRGGGTGNEWPMAAFATAGISALCINSSAYKSDPIVRYGEGTAAIRSVVNLLKTEGRVDPRRVGMGGLSFGSEVALWTAMHSDLLATASLASPFASPMWYSLVSLRGDIAMSAAHENWGLGAPDETPDQWRKLSPVYNLDRIRVPLLFQMAEEEYGYALDYIIPLVRKQQAEAYIFPEEAHQKFQPRHKLAVYTRNLDWFRFWLSGEKDGAPEKVSQYRIWQAMKDALERATPSPPTEIGAN